MMNHAVTEQVQDVWERNELPNPWAEPASRWRELEFDEHGWLCDDTVELIDAWSLRFHARQRRSPRVIELGCWLGRTTRFLAELAEIVIAIDHWQGSPEHHAEDREDCRSRLPVLFDQFLRNCADHPNVCPIRGSTEACSRLWLPAADLVFVDAAHDATSVYLDLENYSLHLAERGLCCGDDWLLASVKEGVRRFAREHQRVVFSSGNFWWVE